MAARVRYVVTALAVASLAVLSLAWGEVLGKTTSPLEVRNARLAESTFGDFVADAARAQFNADIALVPASLLRPEAAPLAAGNVTREQVTKPLFFPDEPVVLVDLSGAKIRAALERSLSLLPQPGVLFLQVSGLTVTYRGSAPALQRVTQVLVGNAPISPQQTYRVAMPDSLAKGNMGYFRVFNGLKKRETGPAMSDVLSRYLSTHGTITIRPGERLRDLSQPAA